MELHDPFVFDDGSRVQGPRDWARRRAEILDLVVPLEYGALPPASGPTTGELLHRHESERFAGARHARYRLHAGPRGRVRFILDVLAPAREGKLPVILDGDGCWHVFADPIVQEVLARGYILAHFDRTELAADARSKARDGGLYPAFPTKDFGALAAWAWGFHRCIDFLATLPEVDAKRIVVTGHSRGGKAAQLAGATDERVALTAPNGSGCGGAGSYLYQGPQSETLADILRVFPYWFSPRLKAFLRKGSSLPFDQHLVKALVAPRALLATEGLGDLWANPTGTLRTHEAAREVYRFLGVEDQIGIFYREGGHAHNLDDWKVLLDFADWRLGGAEPRRAFWMNPFGEEKQGGAG